MAAEHAGLLEMRRQLQELKSMATAKIAALTARASELYANAIEVSRMIADEAKAAEGKRFQCLIAVLDSILKKVGKDYKIHLEQHVENVVSARCVHKSCSPDVIQWMQKMVRESWRKHGLMATAVLDRLDVILSQLHVPPRASSTLAVPSGAASSSSRTAVQDATSIATRSDSNASKETVERRLRTLSRIMSREIPSKEDLQEIMEVEHVRRAIGMQQAGDRVAAMGLLTEFKRELQQQQQELQQLQVQHLHLQPLLAAPLSQHPMLQPQHPLLQHHPMLSHHAPPGPQPFQPRAFAQPTQVQASQPCGTAAVPPWARGFQQTAQAAEKLVAAVAAACSSAPTEDPLAEHNRLQTLPSRGLSEAWLRQFVSQLPTQKTRGPSSQEEAPRVGRKILGAKGDQVVYVDELHPNEMLSLLRMVFLLEEELRRSGPGNINAAHRIPHSFEYLEVDAAVEVMMRKLFSELPFQTPTSGLRFPTREKMRKHQDGLLRKRALLMQRQLGTEARGWMESIPEWVGNRDLIVGPALFRLDEARPRVSTAASLGLDFRKATPVKTLDGTVPFDARRALCPISGEVLKRTWSMELNDWAFEDAVAVEPGADDPTRFTAGQLLSETAMVVGSSSFRGTSPSRRAKFLLEFAV